LLLATGIEGGDESFLLPLLCQHLLAEPFDQRLFIGERGLVNLEKHADGRAMRLDRASFPVVRNDLLRDHPQLLGQMHDDDGGNVLLMYGKASLIVEILLQDSRAEQIVIGLAVADQVKFFGRKRPVFEQFFVGPLSFHTIPPHISLSQAHEGHYSKPGEKRKTGVTIPLYRQSKQRRNCYTKR